MGMEVIDPAKKDTEVAVRATSKQGDKRSQHCLERGDTS